MPELKDIIYYVIYFIGICVTGFFSYHLLKVTKLSAEATRILAINDRNRIQLGK